MDLLVQIDGNVVGAVLTEFGHIGVDPLHQGGVVFVSQRLAVQISQSHFLGQDLIKYDIFIALDGLMDTAVRKGAGGNQLTLLQLHQFAHLVLEAMREDLTFHLIVLFDAVIFTGGVYHPVSYVYQIQQIAELLLRQFDFHWATPPRLQLCDDKMIITKAYVKFHIKNRVKRLKSVLRQTLRHSIINSPDVIRER